MVGVASRPVLGGARARLLLRPARPQGPLQAGVPRCRVGGHPAARRRADVHDPVQPAGRVEIDGASYFAFALLGFGVWTYFSSTLQAGTDSLLSNAELLTKVAFPRIVAAGRRRCCPGSIDLAVAVVLALSSSLVAAAVSAASALVVGVPLGAGAARARRRRAGAASSARRWSVSRRAHAGRLRRAVRAVRQPGRLSRRARPGRLADAAVPQPARAARSGCCALGARRHRTCRPAAAARCCRGRRRARAARRAAPLPRAASASSRTSSDGGDDRHRARGRRQALPPRRAPRPAAPTCARRSARLARRLRGRPRREPREIWSLRDVSFAVEEGEALGIIGSQRRRQEHAAEDHQRHHRRRPRARRRTRGRVGSLLEVGTGFHAELTGLENIYLNGAILGMTRREIARRLDEIVAFAGVERFIDTPVKRYSSGMYLRLGVRGRRAPRGRDPARRRGARRRRRRVPAASASAR